MKGGREGENEGGGGREGGKEGGGREGREGSRRPHKNFQSGCWSHLMRVPADEMAPVAFLEPSDKVDTVF